MSIAYHYRIVSGQRATPEPQKGRIERHPRHPLTKSWVVPQGARHIFAPGIYWDRRRPGGPPLQATLLLLADAVDATVCRRDGGGPSRYGQQASQRENVARTRCR